MIHLYAHGLLPVPVALRKAFLNAVQSTASDAALLYLHIEKFIETVAIHFTSAFLLHRANFLGLTRKWPLALSRMLP
jgi:hypothetical protein